MTSSNSGLKSFAETLRVGLILMEGDEGFACAFFKKGYSLNLIPEGFGCFVNYNHVLVLFFRLQMFSSQIQ